MKKTPNTLKKIQKQRLKRKHQENFIKPEIKVIKATSIFSS